MTIGNGKLLADEGAERAGGETRGPRFTPEERAEIAAFWAQFAALGFNINLLDQYDPENWRQRWRDENTEHGE